MHPRLMPAMAAPLRPSESDSPAPAAGVLATGTCQYTAQSGPCQPATSQGSSEPVARGGILTSTAEEPAVMATRVSNPPS